MKKKITALLLAMAVVLTFSACIDSGAADTQTGETTTDNSAPASEQTADNGDDGALWYIPAASGGDMTRVHTEYAVEKTEDTLDIIRTTYHVELGETPEFDPEKINGYETKETHFTFVNTENGRRASKFEDVR